MKVVKRALVRISLLARQTVGDGEIARYRTGIVALRNRQGFGIAIMADDVAQGVPGLEPLLPEMEPIRFPVWLVSHRELHTSRRIRLVYDLLAEFFAGLGRGER